MTTVQMSVRKLVLPALLLVGSAFLVHGALNVWYTWRQTEALMIDVQRQKADALAAQIEQFVVATQSQISWSTAGVPAEQQRIEWLRLQRNAPAITELTQIGADGKETLFVSRLAMDKVGRGTDFANDVRFTEAMKRQTYVGPVHFPKPGEPYVSIAVARGGTGVTLAEVSVKKVWDMVAAIKVGETGYAYIVDGKGRLIADRDPALASSQQDLSSLPQVQCCAGGPGDRATARRPDVRHQHVRCLGAVGECTRPCRSGGRCSSSGRSPRSSVRSGARLSEAYSCWYSASRRSFSRVRQRAAA